VREQAFALRFELALCRILLLVHSATASVLELHPSALRSELTYRALRVRDPSISAKIRIRVGVFDFDLAR
jgi:hypothetical protein